MQQLAFDYAITRCSRKHSLVGMRWSYTHHYTTLPPRPRTHLASLLPIDMLYCYYYSKQASYWKLAAGLISQMEWTKIAMLERRKELALFKKLLNDFNDWIPEGMSSLNSYSPAISKWSWTSPSPRYFVCNLKKIIGLKAEIYLNVNMFIPPWSLVSFSTQELVVGLVSPEKPFLRSWKKFHPRGGLKVWDETLTPKNFHPKILSEKLKTVNPRGGGYRYGLRPPPPLKKKISKSALNG